MLKHIPTRIILPNRFEKRVISVKQFENISTLFFFFFFKFKDKENRRLEKRPQIHQLSTNSGSTGSVPKRHQSVFTEGTPISSFGVRNDETHARSQSVRKFLVILSYTSLSYYSTRVFELAIITSTASDSSTAT